jgi:hypothetical protein
MKVGRVTLQAFTIAFSEKMQFSFIKKLKVGRIVVTCHFFIEELNRIQ